MCKNENTTANFSLESVGTLDNYDRRVISNVGYFGVGVRFRGCQNYIFSSATYDSKLRPFSGKSIGIDIGEKSVLD